MNLRDLQYFVALADLRHFGKAAAACFVSQPSLSIQIKKLETTLGVVLVERSNKSVLLTDIGKELAEQARIILQQAKTIQHTAKQAQDPFSGELNLGVIPTLTTYLLPHLLPDLTKTDSFPKLSIYLAEDLTTSLLAQLKQGKLDVTLISLPIHDDDLTVAPLFQEELMIAVSDKHPLAKQDVIRKNDLTDLTMLIIDAGHCLHEQAKIVCDTHHAHAATQLRASSLEILRYMVISNIGITVMPRLSCLPMQGIKYIPLSNPKPYRTIAMAWRTTTTKQLLLRRIVDHIKRIMKAANLTPTVTP